MPFEPEKFDFIFSRHALKQGKLAANDSFTFIPRLLPFLKVGSPAMIHMLGGTFHATSDNKYFPILGVWNIVSKGPEARPRVSVVLYQTLCYETAFCISVLFQKCAPGATLHGAFKDCLVPPSIRHRLPPPGWLLQELARAAALAEARRPQTNRSGAPPADGGPFLYAHACMASLVAALDRWERDGAIDGGPVLQRQAPVA
jgi:hypothetical protein